MIIYLAGPMTGIKDFNYPAFNKAAKQIRSMGYKVINPAEIKLTPEFQAKAGDKNSKEYEQLVRMGEFHATVADITVILPYWRQSTGACREYLAARNAMNEVFSLRQFYLNRP